MKLKARIVFEWEYEADPKHYQTDDAEEMAKIHVRMAEMAMDTFLDGCPHGPKIDIRPVGEIC
jgi:hypothetical protein